MSSKNKIDRAGTGRWSKIAIFALGLLLLYTVLGFFVVPRIVRGVAEKRLSRELDREVTIQEIRANPFILSGAIRGLLIKDRDGEPFVSWDEVNANFQLSSFFGKPWVFKEVNVTNAFARVQMDKDQKLNFADLIEKFSKPDPSTKPSKPLVLKVDQLRIVGARASVADLTPREPFRKLIGPLEITLNNFHTDPSNENPYSFSGTTEKGEILSWNGRFFLDPLRSSGHLAIDRIALKNYAALYQDLIHFEIRDGIVSVRGKYEFVKGQQTNVVAVNDFAFTLNSLKVAAPGSEENILEVPAIAISDVNCDLMSRQLEAGSLLVTGAVVRLHRAKDKSINVVNLSKPTGADAPAGVVAVRNGLTNVFAFLLQGTNLPMGSLRELSVADCSASFKDDAQSQPVLLSIDQFAIAATNISNFKGKTNFGASLSSRLNTNGSVKTEITNASLINPVADVHVLLDQIELNSLTPYLESFANIAIRSCKLGLDGKIHVQVQPEGLPSVTFHGGYRLDDLGITDLMKEDLVSWEALRVEGIEANLEPFSVTVANVVLQGAKANVVMETNRTINLIAAFKKDQTNQAPEKASAPAADSKTNQVNLLDSAKFLVKDVVISNAHVQLADRSVTPELKAAVEQIQVKISDISSDEQKKAEIKIDARIDKAGTVSISGHANPLHLQTAADAKMAANGIDLRPGDPYAMKYLGYGLRKGKINLDLDYQLAGRAIKGSNTIQLDQLTLGEKVESPDATTLPVKLGIALLKDRSGVIKLDVPVEGSFDDPKFQFSKVISSTLQGIITKTVSSPFSTLGSILGGTLEDVQNQEFEPGKTTLAKGSSEKLDALAKALYERPGLELELEGNVDPSADAEGLRAHKLEQELRLAKIGASGGTNSVADLESVSVSQSERRKLIPEVYQKTFGAVTNEQATIAAPEQQPVPPPQPEKKRFLFFGRKKVKPEETAAPQSAASPAVRKSVAEMERELLSERDIEESDLRTLATDRAERVRSYLVESGKVESERIFISTNAHGAVGTNGHRVVIELQ